MKNISSECGGTGNQKNIDEFYRMLDKERSGWYDQQMEDQKSNQENSVASNGVGANGEP